MSFHEVPFVKVVSVGNDFVLVESSSLPFEDEGLLRELAISASRRRLGIGSDGLLVLSVAANELSLRMFNPDGSEDFCGNGLRCAAVYARRKGFAPAEFSIRHGGKLTPTQVAADGETVDQVFGPATFDPERVPLARGATEAFMKRIEVCGRSLTLSALSTGSTHAVVFVEDLPGDEEFLAISRAVETHEMFPERASMIWARTEAPDRLRLRIWERGVGETLGCGTGSLAAAAAHMRINAAHGPLKIISKGGELTVEAASWDGELSLRGRARILYEGRYRLALG